jgi:hypothetical protein
VLVLRLALRLTGDLLKGIPWSVVKIDSQGRYPSSNTRTGMSNFKVPKKPSYNPFAIPRRTNLGPRICEYSVELFDGVSLLIPSITLAHLEGLLVATNVFDDETKPVPAPETGTIEHGMYWVAPLDPKKKLSESYNMCAKRGMWRLCIDLNRAYPFRRIELGQQFEPIDNLKSSNGLLDLRFLAGPPRTNYDTLMITDTVVICKYRI